jgi:hypothetical protein
MSPLPPPSPTDDVGGLSPVTWTAPARTRDGKPPTAGRREPLLPILGPSALLLRRNAPLKHRLLAAMHRQRANAARCVLRRQMAACPPAWTRIPASCASALPTAPTILGCERRAQGPSVACAGSCCANERRWQEPRRSEAAAGTATSVSFSRLEFRDLESGHRSCVRVWKTLSRRHGRWHMRIPSSNARLQLCAADGAHSATDAMQEAAPPPGPDRPLPRPAAPPGVAGHHHRGHSFIVHRNAYQARPLS